MLEQEANRMVDEAGRITVNRRVDPFEGLPPGISYLMA